MWKCSVCGYIETRYPGAAPLREDRFRWLDYMQDSIIAPSVLRDVISLDKVTKPALMEAFLRGEVPLF